MTTSNLPAAGSAAVLSPRERRKNAWSVLLVAVAAASVLSGCVEGEAGGDPAAGDASRAAPVDASVVAEGGRDLRTGLRASDVLDAPSWAVGDWFGVHVFFGPDDAEGRHYNVVVTEDRDDSWFLATDSPDAAREEALFDIPILGEIGKERLDMSGLGGAWDFYEFPLADGKTWERDFRIEDGFIDEHLTFTATYAPAIETPGGPRPGFAIRATTDEGKALLDLDYVPDIRWMAHFTAWNLDSDSEEDFLFHATSMGHGAGWSGTTYIDEAVAVLDHDNILWFNPFDPGVPYFEPNPVEGFEVTAGASYLWGWAWSFAIVGAHETVLLDPDGGRHEILAVGAPEAEEGGEIALPAIPGTWHIVTVGAGGAFGGGAVLWAITEHASQM